MKGQSLGRALINVSTAPAFYLIEKKKSEDITTAMNIPNGNY